MNKKEIKSNEEDNNVIINVEKKFKCVCEKISTLAENNKKMVQKLLIADLPGTQKIDISSSGVKVSTYTSNSGMFEIFLYGNVSLSCKLKLNEWRENGTLYIKIDKETDDNYKSALFLDVGIPEESYRSVNIEVDDEDLALSSNIEVDFITAIVKNGNVFIQKIKSEMLYVSTKTGNNKSGIIGIEKDVRSGSIVLSSQRGEIYSSAKFSNMSCKTKNGNIDLSITAENSADVELSTQEGCITVQMLNEYSLICNLESGIGEVNQNYREPNGEYNLTLDAYTALGAINIDKIQD